MRPVQLELTNFGPYRKEVINFTQFDHAPLFLIGGDTGAGKSTLFDAMTVALFATTSGDRNVEEMRSNFAGLEDDLTKVTFYFQQGNHLYRIERVLQQERGKRGGGTTIQKATASLVIMDKIGGQEIEKLGDKIKEVSDQIEQILGLNAEQFKQIILLPQNDFSRFLKEDSKTKTQILKKIFGTGIFDRFQKTLEERLRQSNKDMEKRQAQLDGHFASQVWSEEELAILAQTPAYEKLARLEELLAQRQDNLEEQKSILKEAHEDFAKLQKSLQTAQDVAKIFQELDLAKERYRLEIEEGTQEQAEAEAHLEELQFAQGLQETISSLNEYQKQLFQLEQDLEIAQEALSAKWQSFEEVKAQKEALEAQKEDFLQKEEKLKAWEKDIIYAQSLAQEQEKIKRSRTNYKQLEETYQQASEVIESLNKSLSDLEANRLSLESLHEAEKLLQSVGYSVDKQLDQNLKEIEGLNQELAKTEKRHQRLSLEIDQAQEILKELEEQLSRSLESRRQLMIAQLQAELEDGQPCMVCGSLDHPKVDDGTQANEAALKNLMDKVEALQVQKEKQVATLSNRQATLNEVETYRQGLLDQVAKVKLTLEKHYQELEEQVKGQFEFDFSEDYEAVRGKALLSAVENHYQELQKRYDKEEADRIHYQEELAKAQEKAIDLAKSYQEAKAALDQAKERLKDLQEAHPELESVEDYQERISLAKQELDLYNKVVKENGEAYNQLRADIQGIKGQLEILTKSKEKTSQETKRLSAELDQSLMAEGALTNDLEQIQFWLLEVNKQAIPKIQSQLTSYQTLKQELQTQISKGQELLQNQEKLDLAALTQEVQTSQENYDNQRAQVAVIEKGLKDTTATYQAAKTLQESSQEAFKAHQELSDLVKVVKGENTALTGRLNLEVYVIRQYFQQILDYANANYIGLLTDNRYSFVLSEEGRRASDHFGLDINVYDQLTGSERSVKSLSGGETFIAALAIALSLSEVVQNTSKGAVVEALFIDEGFGSLDKEALTKAIAVLEQIGENRMVGVISHVDDMKEGIDQQLAIIKSHDGSSYIKVMPKD